MPKKETSDAPFTCISRRLAVASEAETNCCKFTHLSVGIPTAVLRVELVGSYATRGIENEQMAIVGGLVLPVRILIPNDESQRRPHTDRRIRRTHDDLGRRCVTRWGGGLARGDAGHEVVELVSNRKGLSPDVRGPRGCS